MASTNISIYSQPALQRIVDHFQVGRVLDVYKADNVTTGIWRHNITTNQGTFTLFSYLPDNTAAEAKLEDFLKENWAIKNPNWKLSGQQPICHVYDRYHRLFQSTVRWPIAKKQLESEFEAASGRPVKKMWRGYAAVLFVDLVPNWGFMIEGNWLILDNTASKIPVLASSHQSANTEIDHVLAQFQSQPLELTSIAYPDVAMVELFFSNDWSISVQPDFVYGNFLALLKNVERGEQSKPAKPDSSARSRSWVVLEGTQFRFYERGVIER